MNVSTSKRPYDKGRKTSNPVLHRRITNDPADEKCARTMNMKFLARRWQE